MSTWAGAPGQSGSADGVGGQARFYYPSDVAADHADNVYVADSWLGLIRRIAPDGVVTTLAGVAGTGGGADGTGAQAHFTDPEALALDRAGNIYVACGVNAYTIRKITPSGDVTTLAGTHGMSGSADGAGAQARFGTVMGVATDASGNVYVVENATIRKITPDGVVTTIAGAVFERGSADGATAQARFNYPNGVAVDLAGNLYVADTGNGTIRKISPTGVVTTVVGQVGRGGFSPGPLPGALAGPLRLAIHGAYLYITMNNGVAVVTPLP